MQGANGNVKWYQLVSVTIAIFGTVVGIAIWGTNCVVANDRIRAMEDQRLEAQIDRTKDCFHKIDVRLSRIEERLGIQKRGEND